MSSLDTIGRVEAAFAAAAKKIIPIRDVLVYEPGQTRLPLMPCVTMLFLGAEQRDDSTGPAQDVRWQWNVYLYVGFADAQRAQNELKLIVPELLRIVRVDPGLGGSCEQAWVEDAVSIPELGPDDSWMRKRLRLVARNEET